MRLENEMRLTLGSIRAAYLGSPRKSMNVIEALPTLRLGHLEVSDSYCDAFRRALRHVQTADAKPWGACLR